MFIGTMLINFLIAGACALAMRIIQTDVHLRSLGHFNVPDNVLFYSLLTSHGQVMFFGVLSFNTIWFSYYAVSKWGRKPLASMKLARATFWIMEIAVVLLFLDTVFHFGAGWYNLMPLTFLPGFPAITWDLTAAIIFQIADILVGVAITVFCFVVLATLLRGKLPVGNQYLSTCTRRIRETAQSNSTGCSICNCNGAGNCQSRPFCAVGNWVFIYEESNCILKLAINQGRVVVLWASHSLFSVVHIFRCHLLFSTQVWKRACSLF